MTRTLVVRPQGLERRAGDQEQDGDVDPGDEELDGQLGRPLIGGDPGGDGHRQEHGDGHDCRRGDARGAHG